MFERIEDAKEFLKRSAYISELNIELTQLSDDHAQGRIPFDEKYCNPFGTMHGGCLYSLADTITGTLAARAGGDVVTVEGSLSFLEPAADTKYVYCDAVLIKCGRHMVTVEAKITDDAGKQLDRGTYLFFRK